MQRQRSVVDSFPETVDLNQGSVSNNTGMNQSTAWDSIPNPTESRLLNYMLSSGEGNYTCTNPVSHNVRSFSGWDSGESSSGVNLNNQVIGDGLEMEHGRSSVFGACAGVDTRSVERRFEQSNILPHQSVNSGPSGNQAAAPSTMQCSSSNNNNLNVNLNAGYVDVGHDEQAMGAGACPNLYKLSGSRAEQISSTRASCDDVGTSSGTSGYLVEKDGGTDSPLGGWSSCKRKALEVNSGQSYTGGSSSCFSQAENIARHSVPVRHSASSSLSISSPPMNSPSAGITEQLNPRIGVGTRGAISDVFPPLSVAENSPRNFGATVNQGYHEPIQFNIPPGNATRHSNVCPPHQSSRSLSFTDSLDFRSTASATNNSSIHRNQFHSIHVPELSRNALPFPWNGALNSRGGTSSTSLMLSGERGAPLRDEANFRNNPRNNTDHPMFVPATEMRNFVQEPTNWSLASGNSSTSRGVPSSSQIGPSSIVCPPSTTWMPHSTPQTQNQQRRSEFSPWTLFPTFDSESGGQRNNFPPLHAGPSSSSEEISMSPGASSRVHHSPHPRSALLMELPGGDDVNGWRVLAADIEGRQRLVTEIRQVLNAMRRGENLRAEDYMLFDPFINGVAELHDRHRDMRLDVDNMSYEELLALEERIGNVNTGLSEETIFQAIPQRKHLSIAEGPVPNLEPCCICREDYCLGDDIGTLDCNHDFHVNCIKQWLIQKNLCPICKMKALDA
ncbi:E3 ubiquitin-protein ligase MBR2-like [Cornus florida]|uniref:E3 ubiquitin-protein ligase MBR2-like n=1 Tax=Cornus florida TaxID=4283 RepID=UPI002896CDA7|nr:E3 ubiquitin-protein ligase MBR2-like [Cornus florida]XP_059647804.1 E3 ubiquitin-protein ligase MBR2-like [Cornus florida]XP_059647805.1 E3 ubiquitin-protein ligase MBR2-like [Cornus florida]XP_059647806.1 E3 ubiquitin-protein ligase MBR2-like [Cornus florida]XP_059647807.1 E3 ubiquitin-protein ligase MBR2-like [Cornus florida]XP_059647809.1 E3 ubiquitin-protein ligase MBR2-like [Cornus florida]XP_059647810.1 E3 ubiquitin-protein ligase MBR2-like [Cornus florida]